MHELMRFHVTEWRRSALHWWWFLLPYIVGVAVCYVLFCFIEEIVMIKWIVPIACVFALTACNSMSSKTPSSTGATSGYNTSDNSASGTSGAGTSGSGANPSGTSGNANSNGGTNPAAPSGTSNAPN
jgi:hypothetical protein